jgi:uncharacterized coiled-coil protein SlyX
MEENKEKINIKCIVCGKIQESETKEISRTQYCGNCMKFTRFIFKEENKDLISFQEGKRELNMMIEELREITTRLGNYMRHFYQLSELVHQSKHLEERIEYLNKTMIESWNTMTIEDGK